MNYVIIFSYDHEINEVKLANNPERAIDLATAMMDSQCEGIFSEDASALMSKEERISSLNEHGYIFFNTNDDVYPAAEIYVTAKEVE